MSRSGVLPTKPVEDVLDRAGDEGRHLTRRLGPWDLIGFGIGVVIGTGIFPLTGVEARQHAGPAVAVSFVLAGLVSFLAALCYAELASSVPTAGSAYTYAYVTMGEIVAWIIGWDLILEFALGAAVVARGWSGYLASLLDLPPRFFGDDSVVNVGAIGTEPYAFGWAGVVTAAAVVFFAYAGFEAVANLGEESREPQRDLPRGLFGTLAVCTLLYVGVSVVITGMVDYGRIDEGAPIAEAFKGVGVGWAASLISIAAVAGLTSVILVDIVAMGRIGFAMGRDGLLPARLGAVHPRWGTPYLITALTTAVVAVLAGFVPLTELANLVSIGTLAAFVVVSVAVPVLRRTRRDLQRPFRVPLSPALPILSALACLYLATSLSAETWVRFLAWLALGMAVYLLYGRRHARLAARDRQPADGPPA